MKMWTTLKNWWKGYKIVQLSNGKWVVFVRRGGVGWGAVSSYEPKGQTFTVPINVITYCLCSSELEAVELYQKYRSVSITEEIKAHL